MVKLQVLNPQANTKVAPVALAARLGDLSGKTIGLYWNVKAGGDVALDRTAYMLGQRFPDIQFKHYVGAVGSSMRHATAEDADRVARECHAVVGTTAD
jgi:hypothetical protein